MVQRLPLSRLPTPLEPMSRLGQTLGIDLWVKRDDLTGLEMSGNKVRKLDVLLADALAKGADTVLTCGGLQSNHARATAAAARRLGLHPVLLLRGDVHGVPESNLLLDRLFDAEIVAVTPENYRERRGEILAELAEQHRQRGRTPYIIPEGGSNGLGSMGYALAAREVQIQAGSFDHIVVAVGSGGTLAGLALGPDIGELHGMAVCDDSAFFEARVRAIAAEAQASHGAGPLVQRWHVNDTYKGPGYGIADAPTWEAVRLAARHEGLLLDPVYTGKAMAGLVAEARAKRIGGRVLFWHTGGAFGLFGRGHEIHGAAQ